MINIPALPAYMALIDEAAPATSAGSLVGEGPLPPVMVGTLVAVNGSEV